MKSAWKIIRSLFAIAGAIMILVSASTSDYYVIELGQSEPVYVWWCMIIGAVMFAPMFIYVLFHKEQGE